MSGIYSWIYVDCTNNIWMFTRNEKKELHYNIMYGEGKWTKESLIDTEVLGFAIYIEKDEKIHIVYSTIKGELRYCTMRNKQWVGKKLYHLENDEFEIRNLKVEIVGEEMHIFYMIIANDSSEHAVLMHCKWNGKEAEINTLQDIILVPNLQDHYMVQVREMNSLELFVITDEGDEASLHYCSFQEKRWTHVKRLYGIQGKDISFEVLSNQQDIHILNRSREGVTYLLDHVCMDMSGNIQEFRVHESGKELMGPLLFSENNKLYSCWLEQGKIFYSAFDDEKWGKPIRFETDADLILRPYKWFIEYSDESSIKARGLYGTEEPDLILFIPNQFVKNVYDKVHPNKEGEFENIKAELSKIKMENKNLEKKIASFNMQMQKKQRIVGEYEESIARILEQKRKLEENYNVYLEVQQNIKKELERTKKQLSEEIMLTAKLQKELERTIKQSSEDNMIKAEFQNKLNECEQENIQLQNQIEKIRNENMKLQEELQFEKNQSIMDRLLRKRSGEV